MRIYTYIQSGKKSFLQTLISEAWHNYISGLPFAETMEEPDGELLRLAGCPPPINNLTKVTTEGRTKGLRIIVKGNYRIKAEIKNVEEGKNKAMEICIMMILLNTLLF